MCVNNVHRHVLGLFLWAHAQPQQSQGLSCVAHVCMGEGGRGFTLMPHTHTHTRTHVHASVWLRTLPKGFYESFVVVEIQADLSPAELL